jgi:hypothetical protein
MDEDEGMGAVEGFVHRGQTGWASKVTAEFVGETAQKCVAAPLWQHYHFIFLIRHVITLGPRPTWL